MFLSVLSWLCPVSPAWFVFPVLHVLLFLSYSVILFFSACPVLAFMSRLSCPGCPVKAVLFCLSRSGCPVLAVLFWLPCSACPVLPVLFCQSCSACPVLLVVFCLPCSACPVLPVLFCLSCSACPVQPALFRLSCSGCPVLGVLPWLSFLAAYRRTSTKLRARKSRSANVRAQKREIQGPNKSAKSSAQERESARAKRKKSACPALNKADFCICLQSTCLTQ
jgi:hypothetical protein